MLLKIIIYISLCFSLFFTFLSLSFKLFFSYPNRFFNMLKLKKYPFMQKTMILSQLFIYEFFGALNKYLKVFVWLTIFCSTCIAVFGIWFRLAVLKNVEDYDFTFVIICLMIINLNTIFRSFVNFAKDIQTNQIFYKLLDNKFFENIKGLKWEQRIVYLIMFRKKNEKVKKKNYK